MYTPEEGKRTPGLDFQGHHGLGDGLGLGRLLLVVGRKALLTDPGGLGILLLVVAAEQVDVVVVIAGLLLSLGGVDGHVRGLGAVDGVGLGGITGQSSELALVGGDVLVPPGGVRVLLRVGGRLESLEDGDISLRGTVAVEAVSAMSPSLVFSNIVECAAKHSEMHKVLVLSSSSGS